MVHLGLKELERLVHLLEALPGLTGTRRNLALELPERRSQLLHGRLHIRLKAQRAGSGMHTVGQPSCRARIGEVMHAARRARRATRTRAMSR